MIKPIKLVDRKVIDPVRYPKVIIPLENQMKQAFLRQRKTLLKGLTDGLIEMIKKK